MALVPSCEFDLRASHYPKSGFSPGSCMRESALDDALEQTRRCRAPRIRNRNRLYETATMGGRRGAPMMNDRERAHVVLLRQLLDIERGDSSMVDDAMRNLLVAVEGEWAF